MENIPVTIEEKRKRLAQLEATALIIDQKIDRLKGEKETLEQNIASLKNALETHEHRRLES